MQIPVNGSDNSTVLVFHLDLPPEAVERFTVQAGTGEWPLKYALGATELRGGFVDVVDLRDLEQMSLSRYLSEAHGVSGEAFAADRARLDQLSGHVIILPASAFGATTQTLTIAPQLKHIGTYREAAPSGSGPKLRSKSAKGIIAKSGDGSATGSGTGLIKLVLLLGAILILGVGAVLWL